MSYLERTGPDILCLQELKCIDENFPKSEVEALGYHAEIFGQKTYNGVAILSRNKPERTQRGFGDDSRDTSARFLEATFGSLTVASVYVPNGQSVGSEKYEYKLEWLRRFQKYLLAQRDASSFVLAGDFNVAPEDLDVHDPNAWDGKVLFSEPERRGLQSILELGFIDTFRTHHPQLSAYSWWDYRQLCFPKNLGLRIDLILATENMKSRIQNSFIDRDERKGPLPSDHAPVITEFI